MRVLVVGGAGYVGSHTVLSLKDRGIVPVIYDNFSTGWRQFSDGIETIDGDLADYQCLRAAMKGIHAVMHFAARAYVGESVLRPREYYATNMVDALNLLNATVDAGIKKFVFSSTCAVYGMPTEIPIRESAPRSPLNPYGLTKAAFEDALRSYSQAYGIRFMALRYFNAAGADEEGRVGELHLPETHLIPLILQTASGKRTSVSVYGNDYDTPDGTCIRDYIHVSDLASAHVAALELLSHGEESDFINLGTGIGFSVMELISAATQTTGLPVPATVCPRRPGDAAALIADSTHAREKLQWSPTRGLTDILKTAWRWHLRIHSDPSFPTD